MKQARVIVAPLNWGIGHATRCIPIIDKLLALGVDVILASDGAAYDLLKRRYPQLTFFQLPSYKIKYGKKKALSPFFYRWPLTLLAIFREHIKLEKIVKTCKVDAVISDNRLGFYASNIPSFYITHQVNIKTPSKFLSSLANKIHYYFMHKYNEVWIPDSNNEYSLAGSMAQSTGKLNTVFLGPLSRLKAINDKIERDFIVLLSGIEPQRQILEDKLTTCFNNLDFSYLIVRGDVNDKTISPHKVGFLKSGEISKEVAKSKYVVSRAGYSSIMDWAQLGKKALLIPTKGQTEQEYLGKHLAQHPLFVIQDQAYLDIERAYKALSLKSDTYEGLGKDNLKNFLEDTLKKADLLPI